MNPTVHRFLEERPTATLGTVRKDGSPQASVVWYLWDGHEFVISTVHTTAKWQNLARDSRCSLCIEHPDTGQMVVAYGSAVLVEGDVRSQTGDLVAKYYEDPAAAAAHMDHIFATEDRVLIRLRPATLITRRLD